MQPKDYTNIIPPQHTGKDIESEAAVELSEDSEAVSFYAIAKKRLLQVKQWHELAGWVSATFQLTDGQGNETDREVQKGDYLRIDVPGPGSKEGDGYDWAKVEELKETAFENVHCIGFRVRRQPIRKVIQTISRTFTIRNPPAISSSPAKAIRLLLPSLTGTSTPMMMRHR